MFGRKKSKSEESAHEPMPAPPPAVKQVPAPPPVSSFVPQEPLPQVTTPPLPDPVQVTPDYSGAAVFAANHVIVQGGEGKIILDVATELREQGAQGKLLPVTARIVMTSQTAQRLVKAMEQAIVKLKS